ncbi:MAG: leucyl/phenylalanyl-tRNA--protein transferase [Granulosicoccus sp.]|nr:leucyl/phenylalanyl-tRNA--protein transferase [Granulosicoccus sp.]
MDASNLIHMQFGPTSLEPFPPLTAATEDGLLAMGGDLSPERLVLAYQSGIFPWFSPGDPILWWAPDPRCVIYPKKFKPSRSLTKSMRNKGYRFSLDQAFDQVIHHCAGERKNQPGTWITHDMRAAYIELHNLGIAHSAEVWLEDTLVGGLYGLALGNVFFGESMFSHRSDASKVAFAHLVQQLLDWEFTLIDCQVTSDHIMSLGAEEIPRTQFMKGLESVNQHGISSNWGKGE